MYSLFVLVDLLLKITTHVVREKAGVEAFCFVTFSLSIKEEGKELCCGRALDTHDKGPRFRYSERQIFFVSLTVGQVLERCVLTTPVYRNRVSVRPYYFAVLKVTVCH